MAVPVSTINILRLLLKISIVLDNTQFNMRFNAQSWKTSAMAQSIPVLQLAAMMNSAALSWQTNFQRLQDFRNHPQWSRIVTMYGLLGGTAQDFGDLAAPMLVVANQLGPASKTTYAEIIVICDQILNTVDPRVSPWPE